MILEDEVIYAAQVERSALGTLTRFDISTPASPSFDQARARHHWTLIRAPNQQKEVI